jgi:hypothetical protein
MFDRGQFNLNIWRVAQMDEQSSPSVIDERLIRLERAVFWHKIGWGVLLAVLFAWLVPPVGAAIGLLMLFLFIGGGMVVFITSIIWLLDHLFPGKQSKE